MNRKEFARKFSEKYEVSQEVAREMCYAVFDTLSEELDRDEDIYIFNLGTFKHEIRKSKVLRHPKTGELMKIPDRHIITFKKTTRKESSNDDESDKDIVTEG